MATDYSTSLGLNPYLTPLDSPSDKFKGQTSEFEWDSNYENSLISTAFLKDGSVTDAKIGTLSANKITAGTIDSTLINVTNINANNITSGTINSGSIAVINISANNITSGTINAGSIAVTNINANNIVAGTVTGLTIRTKASGVRAQMTADDAEISLYDSTGDKALRIDDDNDASIFEALDGRFAKIYGANGSVYDVASGKTHSFRESNINIITMDSDSVDFATNVDLNMGTNSITGVSSLSMAGDIDMNGNSVNEVNRISGGSGNIDFNETGRVQCSTHFDPDDGGNNNLGGSSRYWGDVSYKTLTDRGCLGWFDDGVKMRDGKILSDTEALLAVKMHPTKKTVYGAPMLDYQSLPEVVYKKAAEHDGTLLPRDENDEPIGGMDGAETTSLISIMFGAIKELTLRTKALESSMADLMDINSQLVDRIIKLEEKGTKVTRIIDAI